MKGLYKKPVFNGNRRNVWTLSLGKGRGCLFLPLYIARTPSQSIRKAKFRLDATYWTVGCAPKLMHYHVNPQSDGMRKWSFGRWLSHDSRTLMNEVSALIKETAYIALAMWGYSRKSILQCGRGFSSEMDHAGTLILNFYLWTMINKFLLL